MPNIDDIQSLKEEISYIKYSASKFYDRKIIFLKITNWYDKNIEYLYKFPFVLLINEIIKKKCFHLIITNYDPDIEFISVYGTKDDMFKCKNTKKIFYTMESDLHRNQNHNHLLDIANLSIGFNHINNDKYIRFPVWIWYRKYFDIIKPNKDNIYKKVTEINNSKFIKTKFASCIASWGGIDNLRETIYNNISKIGKINCPGNFNHNDDSLKNEFNDYKHEYLKQFKFNICPENCIDDGYVTEKIFDSFYAGCIPIWNGDKNLEENIINKNAVLYWDKYSDNTDLIREIELLHKNDTLYEKFISQNRLNLDNTVDFIYEQITKLHEKIDEIIEEIILSKNTTL